MKSRAPCQAGVRGHTQPAQCPAAAAADEVRRGHGCAGTGASSSPGDRRGCGNLRAINPLRFRLLGAAYQEAKALSHGLCPISTQKVAPRPPAQEITGKASSDNWRDDFLPLLAIWILTALNFPFVTFPFTSWENTRLQGKVPGKQAPPGLLPPQLSKATRPGLPVTC